MLLLDEPFGALDAKVRVELRRWLRQLHDDVGVTSVFVTHDQDEALEVADRVAVMNRGKIEQIGTPDEVYNHPATSFVYNLLGEREPLSRAHRQRYGAYRSGGDRDTSFSFDPTRWKSPVIQMGQTSSAPRPSISMRPARS